MADAAVRSAAPAAVTVLVSTLTIGGAEQLLRELLRGIDRRRFEVDLCFLDEPGRIGEEIRALGFPAVTGVARRRLDPLAVPRLARLFALRRTRILLVINHRNALFYGVPAAKLAGVPAVVNWHNETHRTYSHHRLTMLGRRFVHRGVTRVVAAARGHKEYVASAEGVPPEKIAVIYNGVDPERFASALSPQEARERLGLDREAPAVGIVAALRPDKAHEVFLDAARRVLEVLPAARFVVAGDGPRRAFLEGRAIELGIGDSVSFLGFRRDVADVLRAVDVFCLSSRPEQETFSVAALEAMAVGIPVVATRVGFLHEAVLEGQTGYLVPVGDAAALAERLVLVLRDRELRARLGHQARRLVLAEMTQAQMVASFERLFDELLAGGGR